MSSPNFNSGRSRSLPDMPLELSVTLSEEIHPDSRKSVSCLTHYLVVRTESCSVHTRKTGGGDLATRVVIRGTFFGVRTHAYLLTNLLSDATIGFVVRGECHGPR